ncbi:MAG: SprB repeat-containing protein, partial [Flavobacteriales bacterium]|nr:SprB repeat-containing protein [Flavobacteriales bacterium]
MKKNLLSTMALVCSFTYHALSQCGGFTTFFNQGNVTCNGWGDGWAQVVPSGGVGPYSFSWDVGDTDDQIDWYGPGVYSVTVIDNNACTVTNSVTITEPLAISVTYVTVTETCLGWDGSVSVTSVAGGTSPYNYNWYDWWGNPMGGGTEIMGLQSDNYQLEVQDSYGCSQWEFMFVPSEQMNITITTTPTSACGATDGDASVSVNGGITPYSYSWDNGMTGQMITGLSANIYIVTVTDGQGCMESDGNAVNDPSGMMLTVSSTDITCFGANDGTVNVSITGGTTPYTYSWERTSDGAPMGNTATITGLDSDMYLVTVTDGLGCMAFWGDDVQEPNMPLQTSSWGGSTSTNGASDGNAWANGWDGWNGPFTYLWSTGETTNNINSKPVGVYYVTITDAGGCSGYESATITEPAPCNPGGVISFQDDLCNSWNGWATAPHPGGDPGIWYQWDNGYNGQTMTGI